MPEIVEVKKYVDYLKNIILDKKIIEINVLKGKYKKNLIKLGDCFEMINNNLPIVIVDIFSKGKFLCFILNVSGKKMYMFNTLGLKGGWIVKNNNLNNYIKIDENENNLYEINVEKDLPNIEFMIKDDNIDFSLYFYDSLSFGSIKFIDNENELIKKLKTIGPDVMDNNTTFEVFKKCLLKDKPNNCIIETLVNQKILSGIGNYLRSEIIWLSKINPFTKIKDLSDDDIEKIYNSTKMITWYKYDKKKGLELGYLHKEDIIFKYPNLIFFVYKRKHDIFNNLVIKEDFDKRYIYYVKHD